MMAFFMTIPTTKMQAMAVISVKCVCVTNIASRAPNAADGSVDRIVSGCA
jgi:hypothetical protein